MRVVVARSLFFLRHFSLLLEVDHLRRLAAIRARPEGPLLLLRTRPLQYNVTLGFDLWPLALRLAWKVRAPQLCQEEW